MKKLSISLLCSILFFLGYSQGIIMPSSGSPVDSSKYRTVYQAIKLRDSLNLIINGVITNSTLKVNIVAGKDLSTNDYSTVEKTKLSTLSNTDSTVYRTLYQALKLRDSVNLLITANISSIATNTLVTGNKLNKSDTSNMLTPYLRSAYAASTYQLSLGFTPTNPNGTSGQYTAGDGSKVTFPVIPTNTNQLTNGSGFVIGGGSNSQYVAGDGSKITFPTIPTNNNQLANGANYKIGSDSILATGYRTNGTAKMKGDSIITALSVITGNVSTNAGNIATNTANILLSKLNADSISSTGYQSIGTAKNKRDSLVTAIGGINSNVTTVTTTLATKVTSITGYGLSQKNYGSTDSLKLSKMPLPIAVPGKNLIDTAAIDAQPGHYLDPNGFNGTNPNYFLTGFIPILASTYYSPSNNDRVVFYDANKTLLPSLTGGRTPSYFITPSTAAFVRLTISTNPPVNFQLEVGQTSTSWAAYTVTYTFPATAIILDGSITSSKILDGNVTSTKYLDGSINRQKTEFFQPSKNLFNYNASDTTLQHYVSNTNGVLIYNTGYNTSGYIPVSAGLPYSFIIAGGMQNCWYDSNKSFLSGFTGVTPATAPANAKYVRFSVANGVWTAFQVEQNSVNTVFTPYLLVLKPNTFDFTNSGLYSQLIPSMASNNPISYPANMYLLKGFENSIYFQGAQRRFLKNLSYTRINGGTMLDYEASAKITPTTTTSIPLTNILYDGDFNVVSTSTMNGIVSDTANKTNPVIWMGAGDSFIDAGVISSRVMGLCQNLTVIGTNRRTKSSSIGLPSGVTVYDEGKSGWTLNNFINTTFMANGFSPFLQPVAPYSYYGNTAAWIVIMAGMTGEGYYNAGISKNISPTTGYKQTPSVNDVMYVDANNRYEVYNGSAWVAISSSTLAFTFNFTKYRAVWGMPRPTVFTVMLGMNDFRFLTPNQTIAALPTFKSNMDIMIAALKADSVNTIGICLPLSSVGQMNNGGGNFTLMQNASLWEERKFLIANYDNLTASGVYVIDTGTSTDPVYGFDQTLVPPFAEYTGTSTISLTFNQPHPNADGYNEMGTRLAAFIQAIR